MKRVIWMVLVGGVLLILTASATLAAAPTDLRATKTASQQTILTWTPGAGTETILYSLNGLQWNEVQAAGVPAGVRLDSAAVPGNSKVIGLTDFTNYYFRIKHVDGAVITHSNIVTAFPPNEHAHRYFATNTNMCASCHATHAGEEARLLNQPTVNDVCKTCHTNGSGSKYQVDFGTVQAENGRKFPALSGFFGTAVKPGAGVPKPTSYHPIADRPLKRAQGGDPYGTDLWNEKITCASCHTAHSDLEYQYRLLRKQLPNMKQSTNGAPNPLPAVTVEAYAVTLADREGAVYVSGMNNFCGGCHADYNTTAVEGPGHAQSGQWSAFYRHAVGKDIGAYPTPAHPEGLTTTLPLEAAGTPFVWDGSERTSGMVFCITCHKPHGVSTTGNFELLRLNRSGVCQECHKK